MPNYFYCQDAQIITSERTYFSIEAASREEADFKAKNNEEYTITTITNQTK